MTCGVTVALCVACGHAVFPRRLLCPLCGGAAWRGERVEEAVIEQVTTVHHAVGSVGEAPISLASVRLSLGPVVIARVEGGARPGARVKLGGGERAPVARPPGLG